MGYEIKGIEFVKGKSKKTGFGYKRMDVIFKPVVGDRDVKLSCFLRNNDDLIIGLKDNDYTEVNKDE